MAFQAKLFMNGEERNVLDSTFLYKQLIDNNGRPKTSVQGGQIHFVLESTKNDELFYDWMFADQQTYRGHIRFYDRDGFRKLFDYEFANCYCIRLHEHFSATGDEPLRMELTLSPGIQRVRDQIFEKAWNPNNPFVEAAPITEREDAESEILESYFENKEGEKISKIRKGQNVFLFLKTQNMSGKQVDIDLGIDNGAFEYKGQLLENNILEAHNITSDVMKIELKSTKQNS